MERANTCSRKELIVGYNNILQLQEQTLQQMEVENVELKAKSRGLEEKHAWTLKLLKTQHKDQKVDVLQVEIQVFSEARLSHDPQLSPAMQKRLRSCEPVEDAPARFKKYRLEKPTEMKLGG